MQTIFIKGPARLLGAFAGSAQSADFRVSEDCAAQSSEICTTDCADPATEHNTSMIAKHSHSMFILSRGDMVRHEVGVCVCVHVRAVCVCNESMNDVTDNAKHNFGDPLNALYIASARSVSENVGLLLKKFVHSKRQF